MATVQSYTKAGVDQKFASRSNMTLVHGGGGTPDLTSFPDAKTGDVLERAGDGARWRVIAKTLIQIEGRVISVQGKSGVVTLTPSDIGAAPTTHTHTIAQITDLNVSEIETGSTVAKRDSSGRIRVATATATNHATNKAYVDNAVTASKAWDNLTGKPSTFPPSGHTHTVSQIRDLTLANGYSANTVPIRDDDGRFYVVSPIEPNQVANKFYVDGTLDTIKPWTGTQAQYDAIQTKDPNRLYIIIS